MKKPPEFLQKFMDKDPQKKEEYKKQLKEKGSEYKKETSKLSGSVEVAQKEVREGEGVLEAYERRNSEILSQVEATVQELAKLKKRTMASVLNFFKIRSLESSIKDGDHQGAELAVQIEQQKVNNGQLIENLRLLQEQVRQVKEGVTEDAKKIVAEYYASRESEWVDAEYSAEEAKELFSEDHLASLSLEDYTLLLKRFPAHLVTHVTRQGVRDHGSLFEHQAGMGEHHDNFKELLAHGRMLNPLHASMETQGEEVAVAKMFHLDSSKDRSEAIASLDGFLHPKNTFASYVDRNATHFASEIVADEFYGGEKGNEVFVAYPSMHIDTQYTYVGDLTSSENNQYNNQWVWTQNENGMDLDAGLIFISGDAHVDPKTGSRYEIRDGAPVEDQELVTALVDAQDAEWVQEYQDLLMEADSHYKPSVYHSQLQRLLEKNGVTDPRIHETFRNPRLFLKWRDTGSSSDQDRSSVVRSILSESGNLFQLAESVIPSQEYWSSYFEEHPDQQPSKVVYYSGGDPSKALREFKEKHGLIKKADGEEFVSRFTDEDPEQARTYGDERFRELAMRLIDEKFPAEVEAK